MGTEEMIDGYREIVIGTEAIAYVKERLNKGKTLARLLLQRQALEQGRVVAALPQYAGDELAKNFLGGFHKEASPVAQDIDLTTGGTGRHIVPKVRTVDWLTEVIHEFLSKKEGGICLLENGLALPSDPWLQRRKSKICVLENDVYHMVSSENVAKGKIMSAIGEAEGAWPPLVGVLARIPLEKIEQYELREEVRITEKDLTLVAEQADKIIVGAYDGEGYLLWNR